MAYKSAVKSAAAVASLLITLSAWAGTGSTLESRVAHQNLVSDDRGEQTGTGDSITEPPESFFVVIGIALIAAIAHRRKKAR
jgi:hypothetical protein